MFYKATLYTRYLLTYVYLGFVIRRHLMASVKVIWKYCVCIVVTTASFASLFSRNFIIIS